MYSENPLALAPRLGRLRVFDAIARAGGLNLAAADLHLSQPAVSNALHALEEEIGAALAKRGVKGSSLTEAGETLSRRTARLFGQIEAAGEACFGSSPPDVGRRLARMISGPQIRSLISIWKEGDVRSAARSLACSQPAIYRPARQLEAIVKTSLFRKTAHGLRLTRAGVELARRLNVALQEIVSGLEEVSVVLGRPQARIAIGSLALAPKHPVALASNVFLERHATSRIEVLEDSYSTLSDLLRRGDIDMIFGALRNASSHEDLEEAYLFDDPYVIVCRRNHPLAHRKKLTSHDLKNFDWVLPSQGLPRRAVLDHILSHWRLRGHGGIVTTSFAMIIAALATSDRLSVLSRASFSIEGASDILTSLDLEAPQEPRKVGLTTRKNWLATEFQKEFISELRRACTRKDASQQRPPEG